LEGKGHSAGGGWINLKTNMDLERGFRLEGRAEMEKGGCANSKRGQPRKGKKTIEKEVRSALFEKGKGTCAEERGGKTEDPERKKS